MKYILALTMFIGVLSCMAEPKQLGSELSRSKAAIDFDNCRSSAVCGEIGSNTFAISALQTSPAAVCRKNQGIITLSSNCIGGIIFCPFFYTLNATLKDAQGNTIASSSASGSAPSIQFPGLRDGNYEINAEIVGQCIFDPICVKVTSKLRNCFPLLFCCK